MIYLKFSSGLEPWLPMWVSRRGGAKGKTAIWVEVTTIWWDIFKNSGITAHFRSRLVIFSYLWDCFSGSWQYHFCPTGLRGVSFFRNFCEDSTWFNMNGWEDKQTATQMVLLCLHTVFETIRISSTESDKHVIFALRKVADTFSRLFHQVEIKRPFFDLLCRECHRRFFCCQDVVPELDWKFAQFSSCMTQWLKRLLPTPSIPYQEVFPREKFHVSRSFNLWKFSVSITLKFCVRDTHPKCLKPWKNWQ